MTVAGELWFGLFRAVEAEIERRLATSGNLFDALLLEAFAEGRPSYSVWRSRITIPDQLSAASDSHVAIAGLLLGSAENGDQTSLATLLDAGLKKIRLKSPAVGMPSFTNDWKLLIGAAVGIASALKQSCTGDWTAHQQYILKALEALPQADLNTTLMVSFGRKQLGEGRTFTSSERSTGHLSTAELISAVWAHHTRLGLTITEDACWAALQERLASIRTEDLSFHELSLLLVVLKDAWASGWATNKTHGLEFVRATLRDFLPCAKRDIKANLIRNEADVQRVIWSILRPVFPDLVDEDYLPKFGAKNYKPDFGIPSLRLLIEAKYVSGSKPVGEIQDEVQADIVGYRSSTSEYSAILFFVYDTRGDVAAQTEMHRVIREQPGVEDFIVVVGPGPAAVKPKQK